MRHFRVLIPVLAVLALVSCNRDPNVAKQTFLKKGNDFFDRGKYKEARLMYKDALQKDKRFAPAYYKLALTESKLGNGSGAVFNFQRAIELLPPDSPDRFQSMIHLSEIYLGPGGGRKDLLDEVAGYCDQLLKNNANSFDGHRLLGDLDFRIAMNEYSVSHVEEAKRRVETALEEYRKADAVKAGDIGVEAQIARVLAVENDYTGAEKMYRKLIAQEKTLRGAYTELYNVFIASHRPDDAEQVLKLGFQNNPKEYDYLVLLARHYASQRKTQEMIATLQQIKAGAKDYKAAYMTVGDFYLQFGDGDAAIKEYREGIDKDPKQKVAYETRIVETLMRQGKKGDAADMNAAILKEDPNNNEAKAQAATLLLEKGNVKQALVELQASATRNPNNPYLRFQLGRAHALNGDLEQARQEFQKAIDLNPRMLNARLAMCQLQITRGEFDAAVKTSDEILGIDRTNISALLFRAAALMGMRKYQEAQPIMDALMKSSPNLPDVQYNYGMLNAGLNHYSQAEAAFRKTYELNPADARGLMGVVETYMAQNKSDQAIALLQSEATKAPNRPEFRIALGSVAARAGKFDMGISEFQKVIDTTPDKKSRPVGEIYTRMAEVYRRKGDDGNALTALQHAREIMPENDNVLITLALTLERLNRWSEARQLYEAALKISPRNPFVLNNLAMLLADHGGDLEDALTKAQRAKQLLPNLPEVSDTLGWIYVKKNLTDSALDIFKDLTAKVPNNPTFHFHLGVALWQKNDKAGAQKEYALAMKNNPQPDEKQKIQEYMQKVGM
jgi:tetratricopeptide (TPR) repeat protein